jgi:hypothetical protein
MRQIVFILACSALAMLASCKKPTEEIKGSVTVYNPNNFHNPVREGLPVTIYRGTKPFCVSHTDNKGVFSFTTEEFDNDELSNYSAYFRKSVPFDSTLVEWKYLTDSTFFKHQHAWYGIGEPLEKWMGEQRYFTHCKSLEFNPSSNTFMVVPAGLVQVQFQNLPNYVSVHAGQQMRSYFPNEPSASGIHFILIPGEKYTFTVNGVGLKEGEKSFTFKLRINNSFSPNSTPGNEILAPDTVMIDMLLKQISVQRACF